MAKVEYEYPDFLCFQVSALSRRIARFWNNHLSALGLNITLTQSYVLLSLLEKDGRSVKEIAGAVQLDSSAITGLVDRLAKEKLVERRADPEDRRSLRIFLTGEGCMVAQKAYEAGTAVNEAFLKNLDGGEIDALAAAHEKTEQQFLDNTATTE